jgi:hypothetical protein
MVFLGLFRFLIGNSGSVVGALLCCLWCVFMLFVVRIAYAERAAGKRISEEEGN